MSPKHNTTIIIPHLGKSEESKYALKQCVDSLKMTCDLPVILAANGGYAKGDINIKEQGQCKAVNEAVKQTNDSWLFVTNDDMVYPPGWWEKLSNFVKYNPKIKCVSPNLCEPRPGAPPFKTYFCGGAGGDFNKEKFYAYAEFFQDFRLKEGFNLPFLITRELWEKIEGYDENYDPWGSNGDSDLQTKIYLAGEKTWRYYNVLIYHFSQTSGTFHPDQRKYWQENWDYFIKKWGFPRQGDDQKIWYSKELIDYEKLIYKPKWAKLK